jgi:hypothetical protein
LTSGVEAQFQFQLPTILLHRLLLQNAHNVLVASSPVARYGMVAKVADLGLSRVLKQYATHRTTGTVSLGLQRTQLIL